MAVLDLRGCAQVFSGCRDWGCSSSQCVGFSMRWLLRLQSTDSGHVSTAAAARRLESADSVVVAHGLPLCSLWNRPGMLHAKSHQSCPALRNPMHCSPPGSSIHGILKQEYWRGLLCPPPRDLPDPGIEPKYLMSPAFAGGFRDQGSSPCPLHWQADS